MFRVPPINMRLKDIRMLSKMTWANTTVMKPYLKKIKLNIKPMNNSSIGLEITG
ncbi:hypothetical protein D3C80_1896950 [compost metagenome]